MGRLVTTSAAADAVGVSRATLWRWIKDGTVTPTTRTAGGHLRWDVEQLQLQVSDAERGRRVSADDPPAIEEP